MSRIDIRNARITGPALHPEILLDPNTPKPLHGLNLRHVLGADWWDEERHAAYKRAGYKCMACGTPKSKTRERYLVAHQRYDYDYATGRAELVDIVALCADCKAFIHSGLQIYLVRNGEKTVEDFERIYLRGFDILRRAGYKPWWGTCLNWLMYKGHEQGEALQWLIDKGYYPTGEADCEWEDWHLVIPGDVPRVQYTMYEDLKEWWWSYNAEGAMEFRRVSDKKRIGPDEDGDDMVDSYIRGYLRECRDYIE